eukprot:352311-Chlamydomonas_euryale.AAC.5
MNSYRPGSRVQRNADFVKTQDPCVLPLRCFSNDTSNTCLLNECYLSALPEGLHGRSQLWSSVWRLACSEQQLGTLAAAAHASWLSGRVSATARYCAESCITYCAWRCVGRALNVLLFLIAFGVASAMHLEGVFLHSANSGAVGRLHAQMTTLHTQLFIRCSSLVAVASLHSQTR